MRIEPTPVAGSTSWSGAGNSQPISAIAGITDATFVQLGFRLFVDRSAADLKDASPWLSVDKAPLGSQAAPAEPADRRRLEHELRAAFASEPLEDGISHPADEIVDVALQSGTHVLVWFEELALDVTQPELAASVLRCLGRVHGAGTATWRGQLVEKTLANGCIRMRDAAVQAAESWGDPNMTIVLAGHTEPTPWLRDYIDMVLEDLQP